MDGGPVASRAMRPYLVLAALLAAPSLPPATAANACVARADTPATVDAMVLADGSFTCAVARSGMTVTVCIEAFAPKVWQPLSCSTRTAAGSVTTVSGSTAACVLGGPTLVRTRTSGSNAADESATATSLPVLAPGAGSCGP